ncbi:putative secreted protein [Propionispora sp. 2/2-37]|uniref:hypothetical protein n=1 Tax=Propionispora sp. 2/2-37 TaxID=1677858 RepID=UPI0006BB5F36|nr:hypothetical protein [Propionispora sp. 2/2-37]CUH94515.1 putative secreted protein [Propionispora sp. 2/2-37]
MKKIWLCFALATTLLSGAAYANLNDTQAIIAAKYGEYSTVIDESKNHWTREEWDKEGHKYSKEPTYLYSFVSQDLPVRMSVMYENNKPGAYVQIQHFSFNYAIKIKDLKTYFPEAYELATSAEAQSFTSKREITNNFFEPQSPVSLGVIVKENAKQKGSYFTLLAFNVQNEGKFINHPDMINGDTYIKEFTIERFSAYNAKRALEGKLYDWQPLHSPF